MQQIFLQKLTGLHPVKKYFLPGTWSFINKFTQRPPPLPILNQKMSQRTKILLDFNSSTTEATRFSVLSSTFVWPSSILRGIQFMKGNIMEFYTSFFSVNALFYNATNLRQKEKIIHFFLILTFISKFSYKKHSFLHYFLLSLQSKLVSIKTPVLFVSIAQEFSTSRTIFPFVIDLSSVLNVCTIGTLQYAMSFSFISNSASLMTASTFSNPHSCVPLGIRHAIGLNLRHLISELIWHSDDRVSWYILIIKPNRCSNFLNLFLEIRYYFIKHE